MAAPELDAHRCLTAVMACRIRVSRLHDDGTLDPGDDNMYVSDAVITIGSNPDVETGTVITQKNGCGAVCVRRRSDNQTLAYNLTMSLCQLDAELIEILAGGSLITVGGVTVGYKRPRSGDVQEAVCFEAWQEARTASAQATEGGALLWWHWAWPHVKWTAGEHTLEEGALTVPLTGYAEENDNMGTGPAADWPDLITEAEAWWLDDDIPDAVCGYQALVVAGSGS